MLGLQRVAQGPIRAKRETNTLLHAFELTQKVKKLSATLRKKALFLHL